MNSKHIIMCIDNDEKILSQLSEKISKIIDNNYIVYTYTSSEEALVHAFENIANGYDILMTISSYDFSSKGSERFIIDFYKHSPYSKNILFSTNLNTEIISEIINQSSIHKIIQKNLEIYDFELMILDTIKMHDQERRLREYQSILEDAVDIRTKELKDINVKLQVLATTDSLTGIKNRRSYFDSSEPMIEFSKRESKLLGVLMLDIDRFKNINDTYGHAVGDKALILIVNTMNVILRKSDILGRVGGEEFAISLPHTSEEGIVLVANKIREAIYNLVFIHEEIEIPLRISIGATIVNKEDTSIDEALQRADQALYKAKNSGRNKVIFLND
jgi:diguanylate cyclase (GGDEF)-like protein